MASGEITHHNFLLGEGSVTNMWWVCMYACWYSLHRLARVEKELNLAVGANFTANRRLSNVSKPSLQLTIHWTRFF